MNTQKIINCIIENDLIGAKKQINEQLMLRIAEAIENRKIELAGQIFEDSVCESCGCEAEDEDIEEATKMANKDYDGDGKIESSKDEVWGSRLKAAAKAGKLKKKPMAAMEEVEEVEEAMMKPKGARGMAQVKRLGRTYKTGGFAKIAAKAAKKYGSAEAGKRVAGAIFQKMARAHARKG